MTPASTTPPVAGTLLRRDADTVRTRLTLPATFDFDWIRSFLTLRRVSSLERWTDDDGYIRSVCIDGVPTLLTIRYVKPDRLDVSFVVAGQPTLTRDAVRAAVGRMFDLDGDLESFIAHVRRDKLLGPLVKRRPHVRLPRLIDPFEGLVRAMLGQQVTVRAASTMTDRFTRQFGTVIATAAVVAPPVDVAPLAPPTPRRRRDELLAGVATGTETDPRRRRDDFSADAPGSKTNSRLRRGGPAARGHAHSPVDVADGETADALYAFPRPETIAAAGSDALRGIGLTRAKAAAIARLAETLASGRLDCARLTHLPSDDVQAALVALHGIGPWTASYVRMRVLGDRDAFPAADLGVIKALEALGIPRTDQVATAERWRPWRAYAVLHLWESLSD